LFGGGRGRDSEQTLALRWSGYAGYDDTVLDQAIPLTGDPRFQPSGRYGGALIGLGYARGAAGNRLSVDGFTDIRAYRATGDISAPTNMVSTALALSPTRRTTISGSFNASYSSFYQFAPFLGADVSGAGNAPTYEFAAVPQRSLSTAATIGLSQRLSSRTALSTNIGWNRTRFGGAGVGREADPAHVDGRSADVRVD
jgi:hypothetical protein